MNKCVYCGLEQAEPFNEEHIIPRAFGRFLYHGSELVIVDRVCNTCNNSLSDCDGELACAGFEAVMRRKVGVKGRKRKNKVNPFYPNRFSAKPIILKGELANGEIDFFEIDPRSGDGVQLDSISFLHPQTSKIECIPLVEGMTKENLRTELKEKGYPLGTGYHVSLRCDEGDQKWVEEMLGDDAKGIEWRESISEKEKVDMMAECILTEKYFRAISKIALNYVMYFRPQRIDGYEDVFDLIKKYIRHGTENRDSFLRYHKEHVIFEAGPEHHKALTHYGHVVTCEANREGVFAKVQLFTGKTSGTGHWEVYLGRSPYRVDPPIESIGHWFRITSGPEDESDAGDVLALTGVTRIIPVVRPIIIPGIK